MQKFLAVTRNKAWGAVLIFLGVGLITLLVLLLERPFGNYKHAILYLLIVIIAAVRWGVAMALYAFMLSAVAIIYFFVPPYQSFEFDFAAYDYTGYLPGLMAFVILSVFIAYLVEALQRERDRAQDLVEREREAKEATLQAINQYYQERERATGIEERNSLARDLHDGLAQSINYIGLKTQLVRKLYQAGQTEQVLQEIERITRAAELARTDVREVLYGLRHTERDRPLALALTDLVHSLSDLSGIKTSLTTSPVEEWPPISITTQLQLLRIVQEALANIQKHSQAQQAQVEALYWPDRRLIRLSIKDTGVGFEPEQTGESSQHFGLTIMRERAERLGAVLQISSQPGVGTEIVVEYQLPVPTSAATHNGTLKGVENGE